MGARTAALPVLEQPRAEPSASLPPLYARWVAECVGGPMPEERHATCHDCAMCQPPEQAPTGHLVRFRPDAKCCTYVPTLPNFLVGAILDDDDAAGATGRASVERRIAEGVGVTPLGLQPAPSYALIYQYAGQELFGRTQGLRCPHFVDRDGGLCGIWQHRNAVCATYFCKFERGAVGRQFWDAMLQLLGAVERHLALWAAAELGEGVETLGPALLPYYVTTLSESRTASHRWSQQWSGVCRAFFIEAARLVEPLSWSRAAEIGGAALALDANRLGAAYRDLQPGGEQPTHLRLGAVSIRTAGGDARLVSGYSGLDVLRLPSALADALFRFDGRTPTHGVVHEIGDSTGIRLEDEEVRRLVDFGVLVPMVNGNDRTLGETSRAVR